MNVFNLNIPKDWLIAAYPHVVRSYKVGFWGRVTVYACSCGVSARDVKGKDGIKNLMMNHELSEREMKIWMEQMYNRRQQMESSQKSGPFWQ